MKKLADHKVDAVLSLDTSLAYAATTQPSTFKLAGLRLGAEPQAIGLPKDCPRTGKVSAALKKMVASGERDRILKANLPLPAPSEGC